MSAKPYEMASRLAKECPQIQYSGPVRSDIVDQAEAALGLKFPVDYRRFLEDFGWLGILSEELYGIVDGDILRGPVPSMVWLVMKQRKEFSLDHRFIIIGSTGYGDWYAIDTSHTDIDGASPVVLLNSALVCAERVAPSFSDFFLYRVKIARKINDQNEEKRGSGPES